MRDGCAPKNSKQHLLPVLEAILHQFPFLILGFHADNGSEYLNPMVPQEGITGAQRIFRDFFDGRANNVFNGRNPFGPRDPYGLFRGAHPGRG
jgi:hypothetical protein